MCSGRCGSEGENTINFAFNDQMHVFFDEMHSDFHNLQKSMGKHNEFGKLGEQKATAYLQSKGYSIKYRNYRYLKAEIDIIAKKGDTLAIVEVRSRSSEFHENIAETVNDKKIKLLVLAADHYVTDNDLDVDVRFDIITILKKGNQFVLEHIEDAFNFF